MRIRDLFILAAQNVMRGGIKSLLCVVAVFVGISSVSIINGAGSAAQMAVVQQIEQTGLGGVVLYTKGEQSLSFADEQIQKAITAVDGVKSSMPLSLQLGYATIRNQSQTAGICGVSDNLVHVFSL